MHELKTEIVGKIAKRISGCPSQPRGGVSLLEYEALAYTQEWKQFWDPIQRSKLEQAASLSGKVWSDAIDRSLQKHNGVWIPEMSEPIYLVRSIVVQTGTEIVVHPNTEIRMIIDDVEHCLIRNKSIVSGQDGPVVMCEGADRDILIQGGIWSDQKNNGAGPMGFRKGKEGLMLGSQGAIVLSNVQNITIRDIRVKDNSSFGIQLGNVQNFVVDGVCVDGTKDGVHLEGPCQYGKVKHIHGPLAGDDVVALNAWDWRTSSLTFGSITDVHVQDAEVENGSCAIRILPGQKIFPNGSTLDCSIERCIFQGIRKCHSIKMYDQPNIRCVGDDFAGDLGICKDLFFEDFDVLGIDLSKYYDKSKHAAFELCEHADGLYFENIRLAYRLGAINMPKHLLSVGPKSMILPKPFVDPPFPQEIFDPSRCPKANRVSFNDIYQRKHDGELEELVDLSSLIVADGIDGAGQGSLGDSISVKTS
jgi:hypothetical protein